MLLDSTSKSLEIILFGAITTNQMNVSAEFVDMTSTTTIPGTQLANSNSTTAVAIVSAPGASTQRRILGVQVYNGDTASAIVTVRINDSGTMYPAVKIAVPSGYTLQYTDTAGWTLLSAAGSLQMGVAGPTGATGPSGPTGATGPAGATGATGPAASNVVTTLTISSGVVNIDLSLGDLFSLALTANVTSITFSNLPGSGNGQAIFIRMQQDGTGSWTVALPSSFKAVSGSDTAVQSAANAYTCVALTSVDNGTRWEYAMRAGAA
jgi:hypothetical protein